MKKLVIFLSTWDNPHKDVIAATLAWLTDRMKLQFEVYYEASYSGKHFSPYSPKDYFGSTVFGGGHRERFYLLNKLFDIKYVIYGQPKLFSSSLLETIGANIIVESQDLLDFYQRILVR